MSLSNDQELALTNAPPWAHLVHIALKHVTTIKRAGTDAPCFFLMPYCLHAIPGRHERCVVNRDYKPLGMLKFSGEWLRYETATGQHMRFDEFNRLRAAGIVNEHGYLHNDESSPRAGRKELVDYRRKLEAMIEPYLVQQSLLRLPRMRAEHCYGGVA